MPDFIDPLKESIEEINKNKVWETAYLLRLLDEFSSMHVYVLISVDLGMQGIVKSLKRLVGDGLSISHLFKLGEFLSLPHA